VRLAIEGTLRTTQTGARGNVENRVNRPSHPYGFPGLADQHVGALLGDGHCKGIRKTSGRYVPIKCVAARARRIAPAQELDGIRRALRPQQRTELTRFLDDARIPPDNNRSEAALRIAAL